MVYLFVARIISIYLTLETQFYYIQEGMLQGQQIERNLSNTRLRREMTVDSNRLPKLSYECSLQKVTSKPLHVELNDRNTAMKKSLSMSQILHGGTNTTSNHYIDQLERFKRNHQAKNKQQRQIQRQNMLNRLMIRRGYQVQRQQERKKREQEHLRLVIDRNTKILEAHQQGLIRNGTFNTSLPVNPITLKYEKNARGQWQKQIDDEERVRKLIRGSRIQEMGTSGYNLINGRPLNNAQRILNHHNDMRGLYEEKLLKFKQNFKLKPQSQQQFQNTPAQRIFKYH